MSLKTIIVTGAGRGIGLAISIYLLEKSHKVVLVSRTQSELEGLKRQYPSQVEYLAADLTDFQVRTHDAPRYPLDSVVDAFTIERYEGHRPCCEVRRQD